MKKNIIKALLSPTVVVIVCLFAAATSFAVNSDSIVGMVTGIGQRRITPSGEIMTNEFVISDKYSEINVNRGMKVVYRVSAGTPTAEVTAPKNVIDYIKVTVKNGTLRVTLDESVQINGKMNATVTVSGPAISEYDVSSAGQITVVSPLKLKGELEADASSAGCIVFKERIEVNSISLEASSASRITCGTVNAESGEIETSSAAQIKIGNLLGGKFEFDSSSASHVNVADCKVKSIDASASSAARVSLSGVADKADLEASSGGSVGSNSLEVKSGLKKSVSSGGRVSTK